MKHFCLAIFLVASAAAVGHAADNDINKSNASVTVDSGQTVGNVQTSNGSVTLAAGSKAQAVDTSNGRIELAANAEARELHTSNGRVTVGPHARVTGDVTTANGAIRLEEGSDVGGKVSTANGRVSVDGAHVAGGVTVHSGAVTIGPGSSVEGGVKTTDGSITVGTGATVSGGLLIEAADNAQCTHGCSSDETSTMSSVLAWIFKWAKQSPAEKPRVVIGPGATVKGKLDFRREVDLEVSDRAKIDAVEGATAKIFTGDTP